MLMNDGSLYREPTSTDVGGAYFHHSPQGTEQVEGIRARAPSTFALSIGTVSLSQTTVAVEFKKLSRQWKRDTQYIASLEQKYLHSSYARIIGLGEPVVGHILQSLGKEPDDWFYALRAITGENPVTDDMAGDMDQMSTAWIQWGVAKGIV